MPLYYYRAINSQGQHRTGDWFGASKTHLYQHLQQQKLYLLKCQVVKKSSPYSFFPRKTRLDDLIELCLQLHQMNQVKIPLSEAILLFAGSCQRRHFKSVLLTVYYSLQQGLLLSQACCLYPSIFDMIFIESITLAEKTGDFNHAFKNLETYLHEKKAYQQQLNKALRYPLILLIALLLLLILISGVLFPQLQSQLQHMEAQSTSLASKSLMYSLSILNNYGSYFLVGLISIVIIVLFSYFSSRKFQEFLGKMFFKIPYIGIFKKKLLFNQFTKTLSFLLSAKIDLLGSLEKAAGSVSSKALRKELYKIQHDVKDGLKLSQSLQKCHFVSPLMNRYVQLGEETGNLGPLIQKATDFETKQINNHLQTLLAWIEPSLIIIMGCLLMWIVMATIIPLYDSLSIFEG
jgi:type IV pilus assembly protein PilC